MACPQQAWSLAEEIIEDSLAAYLTTALPGATTPKRNIAIMYRVFAVVHCGQVPNEYEKRQTDREQDCH